MGILYYFWYYLGYIEDEDDRPIMCINSFAPTNKQLNYVMRRIYFDEDEDDEDYVAEAEAEDYINRFYR